MLSQALKGWLAASTAADPARTPIAWRPILAGRETTSDSAQRADSRILTDKHRSGSEPANFADGHGHRG
jgi:hypothetical protein